MHIEPGLVDESKIWLSYVTAAGAGAWTLKLAWETATGARRRSARPWAAPPRRRSSSASSRCFRTIRSACPRCTSSSARRCSCSLARRPRDRPGAWPAAPGPVLRALRPAAIRHERHDAAGSAVCAERPGRPGHRAGRRPMWSSNTGRRWRFRRPTRRASSPGSRSGRFYGHGFTAENFSAIATFGGGLHARHHRRAAGRSGGACRRQGAPRPEGQSARRAPALQRGLTTKLGASRGFLGALTLVQRCVPGAKFRAQLPAVFAARCT